MLRMGCALRFVNGEIAVLKSLFRTLSNVKRHRARPLRNVSQETARVVVRDRPQGRIIGAGRLHLGREDRQRLGVTAWPFRLSWAALEIGSEQQAVAEAPFGASSPSG